ncbi:hypothetical protein DES37_1036 [Mangrovibacter plantisponsor]|uniref:Uncharacterized protein n=1 Tax=Mangrovibacter plantisponsor TaxID=451513 RepID=A0A317Q3W5_9ENTR|nr:hypothetical protein DES37_1036 [Mangrovibacter plantisponsor]
MVIIIVQIKYRAGMSVQRQESTGQGCYRIFVEWINLLLAIRSSPCIVLKMRAICLKVDMTHHYITGAVISGMRQSLHDSAPYYCAAENQQVSIRIFEIPHMQAQLYKLLLARFFRILFEGLFDR